MTLTAPLILAASMLFGLLPSPYKPTVSQTYGQDGWVLNVRTDTFTRQKTCQLLNRPFGRPQLSVSRDALVVQFAVGLDTYDAWIQLDSQPPRPWRDFIPALISAGSMAEAERLDNATGGAVRIPIRALGSADSLTVQASPERRPAPFTLKGFKAIYASAVGLGCQFPG